MSDQFLKQVQKITQQSFDFILEDIKMEIIAEAKTGQWQLKTHKLPEEVVSVLRDLGFTVEWYTGYTLIKWHE